MKIIGPLNCWTLTLSWISSLIIAWVIFAAYYNENMDILCQCQKQSFASDKIVTEVLPGENINIRSKFKEILNSSEHLVRVMDELNVIKKVEFLEPEMVFNICEQIQMLNSDDIAKLINNFGRKELSDNEQYILRYACMKIGEKDPLLGLEILYKDRRIHPQHFADYRLTEMINGWAKNNPIQALEWFKDNNDGVQDFVTFPIFYNLYKTNPHLAFDEIQLIESSIDKDEAFNGITSAFNSSVEFMDFLKYLQADKPSKLFESEDKFIHENIIENWAEKYPLDAIEWLIQNGLNSDIAVGQWVNDNPIQASEWVVNSPNAEKFESIIVDSWPMADPEGLNKWITELPNSKFKEDLYILQIVRNYSQRLDLVEKLEANLDMKESHLKLAKMMYQKLSTEGTRGSAEEYLINNKKLTQEEKISIINER